MSSFTQFVRCLLAGSILPALPVMAESPITLLTVEQATGETHTRTQTVIGSSFVASLSETDQLSSLFDSNTGELWVLDHDRQVAQLINRAEVQIFAERLASEVAKFEARIASLPEDERGLSLLRFEQLFERASKRAVGHVDDFVAQGTEGEFAGIKCQWHNMVEHHSNGDQLLGTVCLARTDAIANGAVLAAFFSELGELFDIVKNTDTGPIPFPVIGNPMALAANQGLMAIKVVPNPDRYSASAGMEVVTVLMETQAQRDYKLPDSYHRQGFSSAGIL